MKTHWQWMMWAGISLLLIGCNPAPISVPTPTAVSIETVGPLLFPTATPPGTTYVATISAAPLTQAPTPPISSQHYTYTVRRTYPHDSNAFTQGLVWDDGVVYEGTGLNGRSSLRRVDLLTGNVLQQISLDQQYFGEGIAIYGDHIIQLTWRSNTGFVYDKTSFDLLQTFSYPHEGWGITTDGQQLIVSDGTEILHFWDPETLVEIGTIAVHDSQESVKNLNELEYVNGEVFANIWLTNLIARIDPQTGQVTGWIDLSGLLDPNSLTQPVDVLNGIMYDATDDRLFVTGKLWPELFEIELR